MPEDTTDPIAEIEAMRKVAEALKGLDDAAVDRVIGWASDHFDVRNQQRSRTQEKARLPRASFNPPEEFSDLADLYAAAAPSSDADRALVVGYWFQYAESKADFGSQTINSALKNLGHGIKNITSAFDTLMARRPQLVIQVRKAGTTKQARKKYKLTAEGKKAVEQLLSSLNGGDQ